MASLKESEFSYFRSEFDKTLRIYFNEVGNLPWIPKDLDFNISLLSCLVLMVEREIEIKEFSSAPPERYNRDSFFEDMESIGISVDEDIKKTFAMLITKEFISEVDGSLKPEDGSFGIVNFLNRSFPGMPGINFLAYTVQTIEEVRSQRKTLSEGKDAFYQTLISRSPKGKENSIEASKPLKFSEVKPGKHAVSSKSLRDRLSKLRKQSRKTTNKETAFKKVEVKSVFKAFDKAKEEPTQVFSKDEAVKEPEVIPEENNLEVNQPVETPVEKVVENIEPAVGSVEEPVEEAVAPKPEQVEERAEEKPEEKSEEEIVETAKVSTEVPSEELAAKDDLPGEAAPVKEEIKEEVKNQEPAVEPEIVETSEKTDVVTEDVPDPVTHKDPAPEAETPVAPEVEKPEPVKVPPEEPKEEIESEEDIAKKISEFEHELAMACPVCNTGKIIESVTEKGKDFYQCSNNLCHFISWAKPFHFPCPVCKNNFLVENVLPNGAKGLKCPRATCDFQQEDQINPELKEKPKKKKKLVRRVKRKK